MTPIRIDARYLALFVAALLSSCGGTPTAPDPMDPEPVESLPENTLEFLPGMWTVTAERTVAGGPAESLEGTSVVSSGLSGRAIIEVLRIGSSDGSVFESHTLFARPASGGWTVSRADASQGTFDVVQGNFFAGEGSYVSRNGSRPDGGLTRLTFREAFEDKFKLDIEHSTDAGATWIAAWRLSYVRQDGVVQPGTAKNVCDSVDHRAFDFWLGSWNAVGSTGGGGTSEIRARLEGCVIEENWSSGTNGMSFNMYDLRTALWYQTWISSAGTVLTIQGKPEGNQLSMEGVGGGVEQRITWTDLGDGRVRQKGDTKQSGSWTVSYDLVYSPR